MMHLLDANVEAPISDEELAEQVKGLEAGRA